MEGKSWVNAEDLQPGDDIRNADGSTGKVEAIDIEQTSQEMYNLTVDEAHTFFVGGGQWLVHNACDFRQVAYGSDELSRTAQQFRLDFNLKGPNTNIAVFEMNGTLPKGLKNEIYNNPEWYRFDGNLIIARNTQGAIHSEDMVLQLLDEYNVYRPQVSTVYTELQPCRGCNNLLNDFSKYGDNLPVYFSYLYNQNGIELKYRAVDILLEREYPGIIVP